MSGGYLGEIFASLSFSGALVAAISFLFAEKYPQTGKSAWQTLGKYSFILHSISVLGVIVTLFYLIYSHQYQYHYVWAHSSNELPIHFMISCFWEGQEGSFLLWTFWHAVLGMIILLRKSQWRDVVMAVIASVNLILASMILGIYIPGWTAKLLYALALAAPALYFGWRILKKQDSFANKSIIQIMGIFIALIGIYVVITDKGGFFSIGNIDDLLSQGQYGQFGGSLFLLAFIVLIAGLSIARLVDRKSKINSLEIFAAMSIAGLAVAGCAYGAGAWKVGSSPFVLLSDAMKDAPVFAMNPDFVPANGRGLNSLLQNYWMVIHPPTLFLGFASTVVPFAYAIGGIVRGKYREWMRPATPWSIFSAMILGIGIIMGGYWAYETLNFGGYWNWDPVENSSFVPWLFGISSIHGILAYRKSKAFLKFTMLLAISTFIFVLYSTFLTRSGILGETSVHTFTDLGLSGQLIILLIIYMVGVTALFVSKYHEMPVFKRQIEFKSPEFFLFLGVLILLGAGIVISISTSIPVINKLFGVHLATPKEGSFFYYTWTIWFAISLAIISGIAQFLYWKHRAEKPTRNALMRPYVIALSTAALIIICIALLTNWEFVFEHKYRDMAELADLSANGFQKVLRYVKIGFFIFTDEILLFASLFMIAANADVLIHLFRTNKKSKRITGGTIAHIGFGLMLIGMLFSAGYDQVLSVNVNPNELSALPADSRVDNILLPKNQPRDIRGYKVTYLGKKEAMAPVSDLRLIQEDEFSFKVSFLDSTHERYAFVFPRDVFLGQDGKIDLEFTKKFIDDKIDYIKPKHINNRNLYGLKFTPRINSNSDAGVTYQEDRSFVLYPEAEVNESMGLIAHPSRKILWEADIYTHVSSIPKEEEQPEYEYFTFHPAVGDTFSIRRAMVILETVGQEPHEGTDFDLIISAQLKIYGTNGKEYTVKPLYRIYPDNRISVKDAFVEELYASFVFAGINTETGQMEIQVEEQKNPPEDFVVIQVLMKPYINFLWLGTFILVAGFTISMFRRAKEARKMESFSDESYTGIRDAKEEEE